MKDKEGAARGAPGELAGVLQGCKEAMAPLPTGGTGPLSMIFEQN